MLPTNSAPTSTIAKAQRAVLEHAHDALVARKQLRARCAAVTAFTLNSWPGTYQAARSVPASGMWMR